MNLLQQSFTQCSRRIIAPNVARDFAFRQISVDIHTNLSSISGKGKKSKKQKQKRDSGRASYQFVDRTRARLTGGSGGNGSTSIFRIGRKHKRRPDGGHGGNGGSIVIVADQNEQSLRWTTPHVTAEAGTHGGSQNKNGRNGKNTVLRVPCGVVVRRVLDYDEKWDEKSKAVIKLEPEIDQPFDDTNLDYDSSRAFRSYDVDGKAQHVDGMDQEEPDSTSTGDGSCAIENVDTETEDLDISFTPLGDRKKIDVADLDKHGSYAVVAKGGKGGTGCSIFASRHGPLPDPEVLASYAKPKDGETAFLELELKLIADVGLVGFPNAGKSSLLAAMSRATPHIAPYPFTTLNPLVGYIEYTDGNRVCVADVPGLIQGASEGKGKGHDFLRHIERTKALLFIVDAAGMDRRCPISDLEILTEELAAYGDGNMLNRRSLVVANKIDLLDNDQQLEITEGLKSVVEEAGIRMEGDIVGISAGVTGEGLPVLSRAIRNIVKLNEADGKRRG